MLAGLGGMGVPQVQHRLVKKRGTLTMLDGSDNKPHYNCSHFPKHCDVILLSLPIFLAVIGCVYIGKIHN